MCPDLNPKQPRESGPTGLSPRLKARVHTASAYIVPAAREMELLPSKAAARNSKQKQQPFSIFLYQGILKS